MNEIRMHVDSRQPLGRVMPVSNLKEVKASVHSENFEAFTGSDVWTRDGWLVTCVYSGDAHQVRKGNEVGTLDIPGDEILYFTPTAKTAYHGY